MPNRDDVDPTARIISEVIAQIGTQADPAAVRTRVERLQQGLPAEDEFSVLLTWLGRCSLVHKLDQLQSPPASESEYRVPDLIAFFKRPSGDLPVLIEVKTSIENSLSWRPDYYSSLVGYGQKLGLPLLLAWKLKSINFWTLVDLGSFEKAEKNYNLSMQRAFQENLLSELAGDFQYDFQPGVGLHLDMMKLKESPTDAAGSKEVLVEIKKAYFTDARASELTSLGPGLFWLFAGLDLDVVTEDRDSSLLHHFRVSEQTSSQAAHRILPLVVAGLDAKAPLPWRQILDKGHYSLRGDDLLKEAIASIERHIVYHILHQRPTTVPPYLDV